MSQAFAEELGSIPMSSNLGQSLERAHRFAREQTHRAVTLEHLLLALTEDAEAAVILQSADIDLARLSTEVSGYLGRLLEDARGDGTSEPRPDVELLRVMQAAASAAKQSRRKQIDGAIVLAAIVGDGKSPAAGLLKAMGMTFEEAIRALQRANTKARLRPTPKPAPVAAPASSQPVPSHRTEQKPAAPLPEPDAGPTLPQSAEEILAAARARIQRRSTAATSGESPPSPPPRKPGPVATVADEEPQPAPIEPADTHVLTQAIEAAMTGRSSEPAPASSALPEPPEPPAGAASATVGSSSPPAPSPPQVAPPAWTPPAARIPQPPPARPQSVFPGRPIAPGEGPRRPPLPPPRPVVVTQLPQGFPNRPPRAPWPEPAELAVRPPNGALAEPPPPAPPERTGARPPVPAPGRSAGHAEKGLLVESVPRRMRVDVPASAEVRIARDRIDSLIAALNGRGAQPLADQPVTRALSVRLRAPGGDFWIEPATPETQWVENASNLIHDDHAVWRWTVVARRRGRGRLALMVSARTVGRDGVATDSAPPDRVIEVKVGGNRRQRATRWMGLLIAMLVGGAVGRFSDEVWQIWALVSSAIRRGLGG